jgi:hypothetical protein
MASPEEINEGLGETSEVLKPFKKALVQGSTAIKTLGSTSLDATKSLYKMGTAAEKIGGITDAATKLVGGTLEMIPGIGKALSGGVGLIGEGFKLFVDLMESGYGDFAEMSKVGAAGATSITELKTTAMEAGFALHNLGAYADVIKENARTLAMYGGTVSQGRKGFSDMLKQVHHVDGAYTKQLMLMGMNQEQILDFSTGYVKTMARTGQLQNMTTDQMAASTYKAAKEMDALSRITGMQKDELLKEIDKGLSYSRFRLKYEKDMRSGDEETRKRAERAKEIFGMLKDTPGVQKGFADQYAGYMQSTESQWLEILSGSQASALLQQDSSVEAATITKDLIGHVAGGVTELGEAEMALGLVTKEAGVNVAAILDLNQTLNKSAAEVAKGEVTDAITKGATDIENAVGTIANMERAREKIDQLLIKNIEAASAAALLFSSEINKAVGKVTEGMESWGLDNLGNIFTKLNDSVGKTWDTLSNINAWFRQSWLGKKIFGGKGEAGSLTSIAGFVGESAGKARMELPDQTREAWANATNTASRVGAAYMDSRERGRSNVMNDMMTGGTGWKDPIGNDRQKFQSYMAEKQNLISSNKKYRGESMDHEMKDELKQAIIEGMELSRYEERKLLRNIEKATHDVVNVTSNQ